MGIQSWKRAEFLISTDKELLDVDAIHRFLTYSYWSPEIPKHIVEKGIQNSLCFGLYHDKKQIGFARVISDFASFGYLCDVYVEETWRGKGLSKWLMGCVMAHPELQGLRNFCLRTKDAHGLYNQFGFQSPDDDRWMQKKNPNVYKKASSKDSTPAPE